MVGGRGAGNEICTCASGEVLSLDDTRRDEEFSKDKIQY
jgi:hypothetical protein